MEYDAFDLDHWHLPGLKLVELLLLERGKKALHPGVVTAAPRAAHALHSLISSETFPKIRAGELAAQVTVQKCRVRCTPGRRLQTRGCTVPFSLSSMERPTISPLLQSKTAAM